MKRLFAALALFVLASCGPITGPPVGNKVWDFSLSISDPNAALIPHAKVTLDSVTSEANDFGWFYASVKEGCHVYSVEKEGYKPTGDQNFCIDRHTRIPVTLEFIAPPVSRLEARGQIFYQDGQPWRWKGVTAFGLQNRYCKGEDIQPFLKAFDGFNILRVFYYVEWEGTGWTAPTDECMHNFLNFVGQRGFYVEMTAITGPKPLNEAQQLIDHLFNEFGNHTNFMVELVNEPQHDDERVDPLKLHVPATSVLWATGGYDFTHGDSMAGGKYGVAHTSRDDEWPRKAHDLLEYYNGGGPGSPSDPPHHFPQVADEPMRPDQAGYVATDFEAYFGVSAILGAGATFHFESGKYGQPPTPQEAVCAAAALRALDYFPADAPLGPYSRIDEQGATLRTYKVGTYVVRVRPTSGPILTVVR